MTPVPALSLPNGSGWRSSWFLVAALSVGGPPRGPRAPDDSVHARRRATGWRAHIGPDLTEEHPALCVSTLTRGGSRLDGSSGYRRSSSSRTTCRASTGSIPTARALCSSITPCSRLFGLLSSFIVVPHLCSVIYRFLSDVRLRPQTRSAGRLQWNRESDSRLVYWSGGSTVRKPTLLKDPEGP